MKLGKKDVISCLILKFLSSPPILVWTSRGTESIGDMIPSTPLDPKHYSLDHLEGYPTLYNRRKINGGWLVYEMNDKNYVGPPSQHYFDMIQEGYRDFGLDDYNLRTAAYESGKTEVA